MSRGASRPDAPPSKADQPRTRCTVSGTAADQSAGAVARASAAEVQKRAAWCMIRAKHESRSFYYILAKPSVTVNLMDQTKSTKLYSSKERKATCRALDMKV